MSAPRLVVLAAGASARLGAPKALSRLGGEPALLRLLVAGAALGGGPALVVTGAHHSEIAAALAEWLRAGTVGPCEIVENARWREGRTGTVALAAGHAADTDLCLAPVDVPLVPADCFRALGDEWRAAGAPARGWLAPAYGVPPRPGHPIVVGKHLVGEAAQLAPDAPLRALRERAARLWMLEGPWPEILDDLDTDEDRERLDARLRGGP